jgi:catechol 2,3-dioxygenase-like lactoylglutathione lyase family enzyme
MHIGVYTHDLESHIKFYEDVLGFKLTWRGNVPLPGGEAKVATVALGECAIELVIPLDLSRISRIDGAFQHIALEVDNIVETIAVLKEKGVSIAEPLSKITYEGGMLHCFIRGPENERIELAQRTRE